MKKILSFIIIACMLTISVSAEEYISEVKLMVEPAVMNITVPLGLPVKLLPTGAVEVSTEATIKNNSLGPITISSIDVNVVNPDWKLAKYSEDFLMKKIDSKELALVLNGTPVNTDGTLTITDNNWPYINGNAELLLNYNAKVTPSSTSFDSTEVAIVSFIFDWYQTGMAKLSELSPSEEDFAPNNEKILKLSYEHIEGIDDLVVWSSSNPTAAIVEEYIPETRKAFIAGEKHCKVTALSHGKTTISATMKDGTKAEYLISVVDKSIAKLEIISNPLKNTYITGEDFDKTGLKIKVYYNSGESEETTIFSLSEDKLLKLNQTHVVASIGDMSIDIPITVTPLTAGTIRIIGNYEYRYMERVEGTAQMTQVWKPTTEPGWGVKPVTLTATTYASPASTILGEPVVSTANLFYGYTGQTLTLLNFDTTNVTDMQSMFAGASAKTIIGLETLDTANVKNMYQMFALASAESLDVSNFDTSNVTNMKSMFLRSTAKNIIGLQNFNTSKVTDMEMMFCSSQATALNLTSFNVSNVTIMKDMFWNSKVITLDLSNFNTASLKIANGMFSNVAATSISGLTNFNTTNATTIKRMFFGTVVETLDLSSFNLDNITDISEIFSNSSVKTIYARNASDVNKLKNTASIPNGCTISIK